MLEAVKMSNELRSYLEEKVADGNSRTEGRYVFVEVQGTMYKKLRGALSGFWLPHEGK